MLVLGLDDKDYRIDDEALLTMILAACDNKEEVSGFSLDGTRSKRKYKKGSVVFLANKKSWKVPSNKKLKEAVTNALTGETLRFMLGFRAISSTAISPDPSKETRASFTSLEGMDAHYHPLGVDVVQYMNKDDGTKIPTILHCMSCFWNFATDWLCDCPHRCPKGCNPEKAS